MTPDEKRAAFVAALAELKEADAERAALGNHHPLYREMEEALVAALPTLSPAETKKRTKRLEKTRLSDGRLSMVELESHLGQRRYAEVRAPFKARAELLTGNANARRKAAEDALDKLASPEALRPVPGARLPLSTHYTGSYSSQGPGAENYARNSAEASADVARFHGVEVEVRRVEGPPYPSYDWMGRPYTYRSVHFEVLAAVAGEVDVEILRRLRGLPLREQVRLCWKRGVNPRVYNPFLPHGYEEKVGLDYFGGEVQPITLESLARKTWNDVRALHREGSVSDALWASYNRVWRHSTPRLSNIGAEFGEPTAEERALIDRLAGEKGRTQR